MFLEFIENHQLLVGAIGTLIVVIAILATRRVLRGKPAYQKFAVQLVTYLVTFVAIFITFKHNPVSRDEDTQTIITIVGGSIIAFLVALLAGWIFTKFTNRQKKARGFVRTVKAVFGKLSLTAALERRKAKAEQRAANRLAEQAAAEGKAAAQTSDEEADPLARLKASIVASNHGRYETDAAYKAFCDKMIATGKGDPRNDTY